MSSIEAKPEQPGLALAMTSWIGAVAGLGLLLCLTLIVTANNALGTRAAADLVAWGIADDDTRAVAAARLAASPNASAADLKSAKSLAHAGLRTEILSVPAARALALIAAHDNRIPEADRLFTFAERLSRRDIATQLWLIESAVQREDVPGALRHYDRVLRVHQNAYDRLFATLRGASENGEVRVELAKILREKPDWWRWFLRGFILDPQASPDAIFDLLTRLGLRATDEADRDPLGLALGRLADNARFAEAAALYASAGGDITALKTSVRNGGFDAQPLLPVFDWALATDPDLAAVRQAVDAPGQGVALQLIARNGRSGVVARQLMILAPGPYTLSFKAAETLANENAQPIVSVRCGESGGAVLSTSVTNAPATEPKAFTADFVVPAGCKGQWIEVTARSSADTDVSDTWLDDIRVQPSAAKAARP